MAMRSLKPRPLLSRILLALLPLMLGACASQTEITRLQQEVVDLRKQLDYEKQRQAMATERLKRADEKASEKDGGAH